MPAISCQMLFSSTWQAQFIHFPNVSGQPAPQDVPSQHRDTRQAQSGSFDCQPYSRVTCTNCKDGSTACFCFCLASGNFFCSPSNLFYSAISIFTVFHQGFDRGISGILKIPRRCLDATAGSCCDIQTINGTLQAPSSGGLWEPGTCAGLL